MSTHGQIHLVCDSAITVDRVTGESWRGLALPTVKGFEDRAESGECAKAAGRRSTERPSWVTRMFVGRRAEHAVPHAKFSIGISTFSGVPEPKSFANFTRDSTERAIVSPASDITDRRGMQCDRVGVVDTKDPAVDTLKQREHEGVIGLAQVVAFRELSVSVVDGDGEDSAAESLPVRRRRGGPERSGFPERSIF